MTALPCDILREIFLACISGPAMLPPQPDEPRLVLSHVCSTWRAAALSTSELWSEVVVGDLSSSHSSVAGGPGHPILPTWFARSGQRLLSLQVTRAFRALRPFYDEYVFPNLHRCRELKLPVTFALADRLFHSPGSLPYLEVMELEATGPGTRGIMQDISREPATSFQAALKLRRLVLSLGEPSIDLPSLNLHWQGLAILIIKGPCIPHHICFDVLWECTSLEECEMSVTIDHSLVRDVPLTSNPSIILPSLHTLRLIFHSSSDNLFEFLAVFCLPELRRFGLIMDTPHGNFSLTALQLLLAPGSRKLEELDMYFIFRPSITGLREFLAALPHLTILWLPTSDHLPDDVPQAPMTEMMIPRLESVRFRPIRMPWLLNILEARLFVAQASGHGAISGLTSVFRYLSRPTEGPAYARWVALEEAGIILGRRH